MNSSNEQKFIGIKIDSELSFDRLVFSRFLDLRGNLGNVKENRLEKLVSPVKRSAWFQAFTLQNFAGQHFFDVNEVSIVYS